GGSWRAGGGGAAPCRSGGGGSQAGSVSGGSGRTAVRPFQPASASHRRAPGADAAASHRPGCGAGSLAADAVAASPVRRSYDSGGDAGGDRGVSAGAGQPTARAVAFPQSGGAGAAGSKPRGA